MGNQTFSEHISQSPGASVRLIEPGYWHLEIPADSTRKYQLAQLDDHGGLPREKFLWKPPITLSLEARASDRDLTGTWGFGFWNDPFSFLIGGDRTARRFPTLPNAAWFFHASPENYLSFRDDLPATGFLAATFQSRRIPTALLALASPALGFTLLPFTAQPVRHTLHRYIHQSAYQIEADVTAWHTYTLDWKPIEVVFSLDGSVIWQSQVTPPAPLSLVIWIDNQYASFPPGGRLSYGTLLNSTPSWLEVRNIELRDNNL